MGYRLWYDEGIQVGEEWPASIHIHLRKATCMLLFLSPEAVASKWVKKEINVAVMRDIPIKGTFLTKVELPDALEYLLSVVQILRYDHFRDDADYLAKLQRGLTEEVKGPEPEGTSSSETKPVPPQPKQPPLHPQKAKMVTRIIQIIQDKQTWIKLFSYLAKKRRLIFALLVLLVHFFGAILALASSIIFFVDDDIVVGLPLSILLLCSLTTFVILLPLRKKGCLAFLWTTFLLELGTLGILIGSLVQSTDYFDDVIWLLSLLSLFWSIGTLIVVLHSRKPIKAHLEATK